MAVYIYAANIRNSFGTEKSFLIKFLFLMLFSLFPPKKKKINRHLYQMTVYFYLLYLTFLRMFCNS